MRMSNEVSMVERRRCMKPFLTLIGKFLYPTNAEDLEKRKSRWINGTSETYGDTNTFLMDEMTRSKKGGVIRETLMPTAMMSTWRLARTVVSIALISN